MGTKVGGQDFWVDWQPDNLTVSEQSQVWPNSYITHFNVFTEVLSARSAPDTLLPEFAAVAH